MVQRNDGLRQLVAAYGVVEDREDPLKIGRVRVRWFGFDVDDKERIPTESLPWALVSTPIDSASSVTGLKEGDWVIGLFLDGPLKQKPVVLGRIPNIPEDIANPDIGFNDPTPDAKLDPEIIPRPPFMGTDPEEMEPAEAGVQVSPDELPGVGTAFGVLAEDYRANDYPYDVNNDGQYNYEDAAILVKNLLKSIVINDGEVEFVDGGKAQRYEMSRYPLEPLLKKPTTNAFERGQDEAKGDPQYEIIKEKKGELVHAEIAEHVTSGVGTDASSAGEPIMEPDHPYKAQYPYNHSKHTESGHLISFDDTPKAERIEIVHRSGTFNETHPAGDHVTKVKKTHYHFVQDHYLAYSGKDMQLSAGGILGAMGEIVNITAKENLNRDAKKMNANITEDINTKVGRNIFMKVEGDILQLHINNEVQIICKDLVNLICEDDLLINGEKDIKIAAKGNLHLEGATSVGLISPAIVSTLTPYTALGGAVGGAIRSLSTLSMGLGPDPYSPPELVDANADFDLDRFINDEDPVIDPSTIKPGFVLDGPGGDLWKPISDTKPFAVSLSLSMSPHELYEAVPTGELEEAVIQYMKADGSIISWTVIRPKHKTGRMIERARFNGVANGGRAHWVWSKKGSDYPQQMFLKIGSTEWLLVMASVRHD